MNTNLDIKPAWGTFLQLFLLKHFNLISNPGVQHNRWFKSARDSKATFIPFFPRNCRYKVPTAEIKMIIPYHNFNTLAVPGELIGRAIYHGVNSEIAGQTFKHSNFKSDHQDCIEFKPAS